MSETTKNPVEKASEDASTKQEIVSTPERVRTSNLRFRSSSNPTLRFDHASQSAVSPGVLHSPCFDYALLKRRFCELVGGLVGGHESSFMPTSSSLESMW